jgi:hypothetical protein
MIRYDGVRGRKGLEGDLSSDWKEDQPTGKLHRMDRFPSWTSHAVVALASFPPPVFRPMNYIVLFELLTFDIYRVFSKSRYFLLK